MSNTNGDFEAVTAEPEIWTPSVLDFERLEHDLEWMREQYQTAHPFPHIVIDDFLDPNAAKAAMEEFPPLQPEKWNNYIHINERKFSNTDFSTWGPTLQRTLTELNSQRFVTFVGSLLGEEDLIADPSLEGGGLHQSEPGGFIKGWTRSACSPVTKRSFRTDTCSSSQGQS